MHKLIKFYLFIICFITFPIIAWGQQPINGLVPNFYSISPAIDLVFNGESLDPEVAHEMSVTDSFDISKLDPDENTNLWSPKEKIQSDELIKSVETEVNYQSKLMSRIGIFRFSAVADNQKIVNFSFGKKIHNFLLRKNLLRKLGYNVPAIQYIQKVKINFETTIDRDIFISELTDQTMADSSRFILNKSETSLTLIDGVVMQSQSLIYNMALGTFPKHLVGGRRTIRSAYIPLALIDLPESVNMMPWQAGRIILENIKLFHGQDLVNTYGPAFEDAKWITRKISKLSREEWGEIIQQAYFPKAVELLLIEKIISRRNHLLELFLDKSPIPFNPMVSYGEELKEGELLVEKFEGFVDRYSFGDPDSPFSLDEMSFFFLSKGISTAITNAISQINSLPFMAVDEQSKVQEHIQKIYQTNGPLYEAPLKAWFFPTAKGQIIISRDIVTGSYMGTNNQVQLVDTIGGYADAGVFMGIEGIDHIANVSAKSTLQYQRTYSHVKPIKSLKKALKEPFQNMIVPIVLKQLGKPLGSGSNDLQISSIVNKLKKALSVGESFIITDSFGGSLSLDANMSVSSLLWLDPKLLKAYAQLKKSKMIIRRIHITRKDKNTIQVYNDIGKANKLAFTFKLSSYIPILSIAKRWNKAKAKVDFYSIALNDSPSKLKLSLKALKSVLVQSKVNNLKLIQTPFKITHAFKERAHNLNLFIWEKNRIKSFDEIAITHPKGGTKSFYRQYNSKTIGKDIEGFAFETVSNLVNILWDQNIFINQTSAMNPGYGIFGKAKNEIIISEAINVDDGIKSIFTHVKILKNGWKSKKHKLIKLIKKMNKKYGEELFRDTDLQNTKSILLYQLGIDFYISEIGNDHLLNIKKAKLRSILSNKSDLDNEKGLGLVNKIMSLIQRVKINKKNYPKFALEKSNQLISKLVNNCNIKQLREIFGKNGILVTAKLEGFRQGDEMGDTALISNTYGHIKNISSPLIKIIEKTKISKGELMLNWMMERAI